MRQNVPRPEKGGTRPKRKNSPQLPRVYRKSHTRHTRASKWWPRFWSTLSSRTGTEFLNPSGAHGRTRQHSPRTQVHPSSTMPVPTNVHIQYPSSTTPVPTNPRMQVSRPVPGQHRRRSTRGSATKGGIHRHVSSANKPKTPVNSTHIPTQPTAHRSTIPFVPRRSLDESGE